MAFGLNKYQGCSLTMGIVNFCAVPVLLYMVFIGVKGNCQVEPPPVQFSYRQYDNKGRVIYTCRDRTETGTSQIVRTCADSYDLQDFQFCDYNCGPEFPLEAGAQVVTSASGDKYYECNTGFEAYSSFEIGPYNRPECDRRLETYKQPKIGCFVAQKNYVAGNSPVYKGKVDVDVDKTVDGNMFTWVKIPAGQLPTWECKLNLAEGPTEVTNIQVFYTFGKDGGRLKASVAAGEDGEEIICGESEGLDMVTDVIMCPQQNGYYPRGDRVRLYTDMELFLLEVNVQGRTFQYSCPPPPPLHGMILTSFTYLEAYYACKSGWHKISGKGAVTCQPDRTWEVPTLICSDEVNLAKNRNLGKAQSRDSNATIINSEPNFVNATDGSDETCTSFFNCTNFSNHTVVLERAFEIKNVVLLFDEDFLTQNKASVKAGTKDCEKVDAYDLNMVSFECPSRPVSDTITLTLVQADQQSQDGDVVSVCSLCEVKVFGRDTASPDSRLECFQDKQGRDYRGTQDVTVSGRICQAWSTQSPHRHTYTNGAFFPDEDILDMNYNYCRYPTKEGDQGGKTDANGPWCYTTDPEVVWEECSVPSCLEICALRKDGADYLGAISHTKDGIQCLAWPTGTEDEDSDQRGFAFVSDFPDWPTKMASQHNFCRNPASSQSGPWCFVLKNGTSELCEIPECPSTSEGNFQSISLHVNEFLAQFPSKEFEFSLVFSGGLRTTFTKTTAFALATFCFGPAGFVHLFMYDLSKETFIMVQLNCTEEIMPTTENAPTTEFHLGVSEETSEDFLTVSEDISSGTTAVSTHWTAINTEWTTNSFRDGSVETSEETSTKGAGEVTTAELTERAKTSATEQMTTGDTGMDTTENIALPVMMTTASVEMTTVDIFKSTTGRSTESMTHGLSTESKDSTVSTRSSPRIFSGMTTETQWVAGQEDSTEPQEKSQTTEMSSLFPELKTAETSRGTTEQQMWRSTTELSEASEETTRLVEDVSRHGSGPATIETETGNCDGSRHDYLNQTSHENCTESTTSVIIIQESSKGGTVDGQTFSTTQHPITMATGTTTVTTTTATTTTTTTTERQVTPWSSTATTTKVTAGSNFNSSTSATRGCCCRCICSVADKPLVVAEADEKVQEIQTSLKVDAKSLSRTVRRKTSAPDQRLSAIGSGVIAILVIFFVVFSIILSDIVNVLWYFARLIAAVKKRWDWQRRGRSGTTETHC